MRRLSLAVLFVSALLSACVSVPNTTACTVAGTMTAGAICAESNTSKTKDLSLDELIEMLEPKPERPDPDHPGQTLPARAGAMIQSAEDWNKTKTALEQACRQLGQKCTYSARAAIQRMGHTPLVNGIGAQ